jgi:hypothetical protein
VEQIACNRVISHHNFHIGSGVSARAVLRLWLPHHNGVIELTRDPKQAQGQVKDRAEAAFKKKEQQAVEGRQAMAEYIASAHAIRERTARLRALRLARDAAVTAPPAAGKRKSNHPKAAA